MTTNSIHTHKWYEYNIRNHVKMKTKHKSCVAAAAVAAGAGEKMKSVILYPYGPLMGTGCCRTLHAKNLALTSAAYTINISILIVLIYCWRINVNITKSTELEDVYYGVQVAYFAIIGTQMSMIVLSIMLVFGIYKENPGLIVPWIIGYITFMALEAVAMVYSNVLRDHVNKQFDVLCKAEVAFFIARAFINVLAMWGVLRFYNLVRAGITWKGPEVIELSYNVNDSHQVENRLTHCSQTYHHISHYPPQAKTASSSSAYYYYSGNGRRDNECRHGKRTRRECHYVFGERPRKPTGCCFFDIDDYDDDDDLEDSYDEYYKDDYDDDNDEDDDYVDGDDDEEAESSDCSMLGATVHSGKRHGCHQQKQQQQQQHTHRPYNNNIRTVLLNKRHHKYKITCPQTRLEVINESERSAGSGSDENDSLLVAYDSTSSLASV